MKTDPFIERIKLEIPDIIILTPSYLMRKYKLTNGKAKEVIAKIYNKSKNKK